MIEIYGSPKSSSGRCFWCLEEVGVEYASKSVNFKEKEHQSESYLKINPNGKVPTLVDNGYSIWESMAINYYLAEKYKPEILGKNIQEKGWVQQWSYWAIADLQSPIINAFIQLVFVPEERRNHDVIKKTMEKLPKLIGVLDENLSGRSFILGDQFSLADINVASVVLICHDIKFELSDYNNVQKWFRNLEEILSFKNFIKLYNS